jgi:hypothetical protein
MDHPMGESRSDARRREAQGVRDRLKAEGRDRDAQIITELIASHTSSTILNQRLQRELQEAKAGWKDA